MNDISRELIAVAARLAVEDGMDYGSAKRQAQKQLGLPARFKLPDNHLVEAEVRAYIQLFYADTQPAELDALRRLALQWMNHLAAYRPHIAGAVWNGTATHHSDIHLQLFCDDPKSTEIALIDNGIRYTAQSLRGFNGKMVDVLSFSEPHPDHSDRFERVGIHLAIHDHDDLRGALKPTSRGAGPDRGDLQALQRRMNDPVTKPDP